MKGDDDDDGDDDDGTSDVHLFAKRLRLHFFLFVIVSACSESHHFAEEIDRAVLTADFNGFAR